MAEIINLRRVRKKKLRQAEEAQAADNRAAFGRPKAERDRVEAETDLRDKQLDGHRLEPDEPA